VEWEIHVLLTVVGHCKRLKMLRKFYVENMDRKHHLEELGADKRIKFCARLHGVTSRKMLSSATSKKTSHFLSD
jgi:hypothetical protein